MRPVCGSMRAAATGRASPRACAAPSCTSSTIPTPTGRSMPRSPRPASTTSPPRRRCRSSRALPMSLISAITIMLGGPSSTPRNAASSPGSKPTPRCTWSRNCRCRRRRDPLRPHRPSAGAPRQRPEQPVCRTRCARCASSSRPARCLRILSNDLDAATQEIADLYKRRWAIELFFRWVKQTLKIRRFLGTSENAVRIQIAVALIAFLLLRLAQAGAASRHQPTRLRPPRPRQPDASPTARPPARPRATAHCESRANGAAMELKLNRTAVGSTRPSTTRGTGSCGFRGYPAQGRT